MPKGIGYGSRKTSGGGTSRQQSAAGPGLTPGGTGGTKAIYAGQPTDTGEKGSMGPALETPNMYRDPAGNSSPFPKGKK